MRFYRFYGKGPDVEPWTDYLGREFREYNEQMEEQKHKDELSKHLLELS